MWKNILTKLNIQTKLLKKKKKKKPRCKVWHPRLKLSAQSIYTPIYMIYIYLDIFDLDETDDEVVQVLVFDKCYL